MWRQSVATNNLFIYMSTRLIVIQTPQPALEHMGRAEHCAEGVDTWALHEPNEQ